MNQFVTFFVRHAEPVLWLRKLRRDFLARPQAVLDELTGMAKHPARGEARV
jgi:hypothetical protein